MRSLMTKRVRTVKRASAVKWAARGPRHLALHVRVDGVDGGRRYELHPGAATRRRPRRPVG